MGPAAASGYAPVNGVEVYWESRGSGGTPLIVPMAATAWHLSTQAWSTSLPRTARSSLLSCRGTAIRRT